MIKSLLEPGFSIFYTILLKSKSNKNLHKKGPTLIIEPFAKDLRKLYVNKRFSDVSYVSASRFKKISFSFFISIIK